MQKKGIALLVATILLGSLSYLLSISNKVCIETDAVVSYSNWTHFTAFFLVSFQSISPLLNNFFYSCPLLPLADESVHIGFGYRSNGQQLLLTSNQCCGSMTFWVGSGSGSGSADPCLWLMDPDPDADPDLAIFVIHLPKMPTKK